jgi:hypothetical protein
MDSMVKSITLALSLIAVAALPGTADHRLPPDVSVENLPYNARFTFVRLRFTPAYWGPGPYMWGLDLKWNHDYPRAGVHLEKMLENLTNLGTNQGVENVFALDDPELFKYPWAYMCEVGFWTLTDSEAQGLRDYLLKGGFLVVDDLVLNHLENFKIQMHRVLPDARLIEIGSNDPFMDDFFHIDPSKYVHPYYPSLRPVYYGIYEDNDPGKRMMVLVNYNNDIGEYWEWSDTDYAPIELSNEAYKLGINEVIYGYTH